MDNEFILYDRLEKIRQVVGKYGEENFCISFSGGKDSTVLHYLVDMALPENKIPRVYADTGIELNMIREFVSDLSKSDPRIILLKPKIPIIPMLQKEGYPFKSKEHAKWLDIYQRLGMRGPIKNYIGEGDKSVFRPCPKVLRYQFSSDFTLRVSDKCCHFMKEEPLDTFRDSTRRKYTISGIMRDEGGRRRGAQCLAFSGKRLVQFHPLAPISKEWEEWFINTYNIEVCDLYKPPYNFERTGCKGCPFARKLQHELDILETYFPNERKQCEIIWGPVYDEYRRIGYRLKREV